MNGYNNKPNRWGYDLFTFTSSELIILITGMITAFIVSIFAIKFLLKYIRKNDFTVFGYYRIVLGIIVILYFLFK